MQTLRINQRSAKTVAKEQKARAYLTPPSATGEVVTETTALAVSAFWRAVNLICDAVGTTPLILYQRDGDNKSRARDDPLYDLMHDRPNPEQTPYSFKSTLQLSVLMRGNGYAEIERDGANRPINLWPLTSQRVTPERYNGQLRYRVDLIQGPAVYLPAANVLHVAGLGFDGLQGLSVLDFAKQCLGLALAQEKYAATTFGNRAAPAGILTVQGALEEEAKAALAAQWQSMYGGLSNAARTAILEEGTTFTPVSLSPEDVQLLTNRKFQVTEIARWFGVPPHMLYDLERSTNNNIEHQGLEFHKFSLLPHFTKWEQECNRKLLTGRERFYEFLPDALLRGDILTRYRAYDIGRRSGWLSANDIRRAENQNDIPGGDVYLAPLNMAPLSQSQENLPQ